MPKMEKVYLHNPSSEETITLVSISATTSHFHASFFQNRVSYSAFSKLVFSFPLPTPNGSLISLPSLNEVLTAIITYLKVLRYCSSWFSHQLPSKFELSTEKHTNSTRRGVKYCIGVLTMLVMCTVTDSVTADLHCCWSDQMYIALKHI